MQFEINQDKTAETVKKTTRAATQGLETKNHKCESRRILKYTLIAVCKKEQHISCYSLLSKPGKYREKMTMNET